MTNTAMQPLHIDLQEGFLNDTVVIRVNGKEVFRKENVKTKTQVGWTYVSERVEVPEGAVSVDVILPQKGVSRSIPLRVSKPVFPGVSLAPDGKITRRIQDTPFGYL